MTPLNTNSTPSTTVSTSPESKQAAPPWLAQFVIVARLWFSTALLKRFNADVHVLRGRAGLYDVCDFVLLMLGYAISNMASFEDFYARLAPFTQPIAALWARHCIPSRSALGRFLTDVDDDALDAMRTVLTDDLLTHGAPPDHAGGFYDRTGRRHIIFDADPTVRAARQRGLVNTDQHPPPRRRRAKACAKGYTGRKRGQLIRSRLTLQQAHTSEWLGSWASAGGGTAGLTLSAPPQPLGSISTITSLSRA